MGKKREYNIEVLRCLLMFFIVLFHCTKFGIYENLGAWWMFPLTTLLMWHVDCFVSISGWFGIKPTLWKFMRLWGIVFFYSLVSFVWAILTGHSESLKDFTLCGGWFVGAYLGLMLVSPVLNAAVRCLCGEGRSAYIKVWALFALMMVLTWIPGHLFTGVSPYGVTGGGTLAVFMFVYFTARGVKETFTTPIKRRHLSLGAIAFVVISLLIQTAWFWGRMRVGRPAPFSGYCSIVDYSAPHVWVMSFVALMYFAWHIKVSERIGRIFAFLGPSMFSVYLLHGPCKFGHSLYRELQAWLAVSTSLHPMVVIVLSAIGVFAFCVIIDLVRRGLLASAEVLIKNWRTTC